MGRSPPSIDELERKLLVEEEEDEDEQVLYRACFSKEMEEHYIKYETTQWLLYSLLLVLAWGFGLLMLLYIPIRRYVVRKDFRSRHLYLTPNAIVYKVTRPVPLPCFGVLSKEKHLLLPSVADVVIEQGYLQSMYGVYSIRIENVGVPRPPRDDLKIQGVANPRDFKNAVLTRLSNMKAQNLTSQESRNQHLRLSSLKRFGHESEELILQKLEEVGSSVKRVQRFVEEKHRQKSESVV